jgi:hypothetical protein
MTSTKGQSQNYRMLKAISLRTYSFLVQSEKSWTGTGLSIADEFYDTIAGPENG